jgi:hypothetical protein
LFPWGSLLRAVVAPERDQLARISRLCAPGARIEVVTAIEPAADAGELRRLGLEGLSLEAIAQGWCGAGFRDVALAALDNDHPYQTTWWRKIRQRNGRTAVLLSARAP